MAGVNNNLIPPVKGEIRNPGGKPKGTLNSKTVLRKWLALEEVAKNPVTGKQEKMSQLDIISLIQLSNARKGDLPAFKEILDRFEGRTQTVKEDDDGTTNIFIGNNFKVDNYLKD